jgi:hypothetical protein
MEHTGREILAGDQGGGRGDREILLLGLLENEAENGAPHLQSR